ncbi:MAG: hypothetical protein ACHQZQ_04210 [SAR324 cluster bacterium]
MDLMDPTASPDARELLLAPRPKDLTGLRVGLIDNTKFNSRALLLKVAQRLERSHGMRVTLLHRKRSPSHEVAGSAVGEFKAQADFVVSGIGD